jgi:predicted glycoside hydrolase/deacetylase ChbG (UPF0249 family)
MKYLIVSADDFGLSESINRGIIRSREEGIVTCLNVIPTGRAFYDAMALLRSEKSGEISAHLALTETSPVAPIDKIPTLLSGEKTFHKGYAGFLADFLLRKVDHAQVYIELKGQLDRLKETGFPITSLSSHQHIHMLPGILDIFVRLAKEYNIPSIRYLHNDRFTYPYNSKKIFKKIILGIFDKKNRMAFDKASIKYTDNFLGFFDSGNIREERLLKMLKNLPEGTTELVTHPGFISAEVIDRCVFHKNCETDLGALTSRCVKKAITDNGIKLITFGEFAKLPKS